MLIFYQLWITVALSWGKNSHCKSKISTIQRRAARLILNKPKRSASCKLLGEVEWLSFDDRCKYHTALLVFKTMQNDAPQYMCDILKFSANKMHHLRSESNKNLILPAKPRTNYYKKSFSYNSFNVWNSIPISIKMSRNVQTFKSRCKKYYLKQK